MPHGAAGYYLLGRVCRLSNRAKQAVQFFAAALALDPLLWCAYEELCILGAPTRPEMHPSARHGDRHRSLAWPCCLVLCTSAGAEEAPRLLRQGEAGAPAKRASAANAPAE